MDVSADTDKRKEHDSEPQVQGKRAKLVLMMIGVPTHGFILGHSMPPTLPKIQKMNIYTNLSEKNIYFKILQKKIYILKFQKKITKIINNLYFIICKGGY